MDEYLQSFIRESEENITELNNSLLELENDPENEDAMDGIFRTAHTLKGNFGAMGLHRASDIAHAIEDLLDDIRDGEMTATSGVMDLVFDGVDEIERTLDVLANRGEVPDEPLASDRADGIIERIRSKLDEAHESDTASVSKSGGAAPQETEAVGAEKVEDAIGSFAASGALSEIEGNVYHVTVSMPNPEMKGVEAMFALDEIETEFEVIASNPDLEEIKEGEYDDGFEVFVTSEEPKITVSSMFTQFSKIESADVADITDDVWALATGETEKSAATGAVASFLESLSSGRDDDSSATAETAAEQADEEPEGEEKGALSRALDRTPLANRQSDSNDAVETPAADADVSDDDLDEGAADSGSDTSSESSDAIKSVRVDVERLDELHSTVEQLVTSRIKLRRSIEEGERRNATDNLDELDKITSTLQDTVMDMRLIPIKKVVDKFPRLVRDLARSQDKQVDFEMDGKDIELDRTILNEISDPLMHLLRNAVDHGLESPSERAANGKPETGQVTLRAERERDRVTIEVEDDGGGLDVDSIRRKAIEKSIVSRERAMEMDDSDVYELIFHAGFSTTDEVTDVSGRGVGMDVVNDTIRRLDGTINVKSEPGEGTCISLKLPVTVAIVKVLLVKAGDEEYGIPIKNIDEIARPSDIRSVEGEEVITHDEQVYPIVRLEDALNVPETVDGGGMLVRINESDRQIAVHCDDVNRQEEVVVKPFEGILSGIPGLSGAAVLGEGDVVTILDVETL